MALGPDIPLDIKELLRECVLGVFWPKKKIREFFESVGCPSDILELADDGEASRRSIVVTIFSRLSSRPDRGYSIFQSIIDRMMNWSYFEPYWFETTGKLVRSEADEKLNRLREAVNSRNSTTEARRQSYKSAEKGRITAKDLSALKTAFAKMFGSGMTVQARGRLFEKFLKELFTRQSVIMGDPFELEGEQIDGTFKFEGENYIVEAKWQEASVATGDLYKFAHKVDGKMHGRGLFISVNGFSNEAIRAIVVGKQIQTILLDGQDLSFVLEDQITLEKMLDYKIRAAQTRGEVYVCALRQESRLI